MHDAGAQSLVSAAVEASDGGAEGLLQREITGTPGWGRKWPREQPESNASFSVAVAIEVAR